MPSSPWQGRVALAAVATGATVAAVSHLSDAQVSIESRDVAQASVGALVQSTWEPGRPGHSSRTGSDGQSGTSTSTVAAALPAHRETPELAVMDDDTDIADVASLTKAVKVGEQLAANAARIKSALSDGAPQAAIFGGQEFVKPTTGTFTSGFGGRWGTTHYGIDLANRIGTPIYAVTEGTVISSGAASGFGMWVRILHPGGWISVYGHINRSLVHVGQKVDAGEEIAEMGNRGQSTGPHLHFEIWDPSGRKLNPLPWLAARGIRVSGNPGVTAD